MDRIFVRLEGEEKLLPLPGVPLTYQELLEQVRGLTGAKDLNVHYKGWVVSDTKELLCSYLDCREDRVEFVIDDDPQGYLKVPIMTAPVQFEAIDGLLKETDLLQLISEIGVELEESISNTNKYFIAQRSKLYKTNENEWKKTAIMHIASQKPLINDALVKVCGKHSVSLQAFQRSCNSWSDKQEVIHALQRMTACTAVENTPKELTEDKLREIIEYTVSFLERYLAAHPPQSQVDTLLLKMREGDEVFAVFGFDENEVSSAISTFRIQSRPDWASLISRYARVTDPFFQDQLIMRRNVLIRCLLKFKGT